MGEEHFSPMNRVLIPCLVSLYLEIKTRSLRSCNTVVEANNASEDLLLACTCVPVKGVGAVELKSFLLKHSSVSWAARERSLALS